MFVAGSDGMWRVLIGVRGDGWTIEVGGMRGDSWIGVKVCGGWVLVRKVGKEGGGGWMRGKVGWLENIVWGRRLDEEEGWGSKVGWRRRLDKGGWLYLGEGLLVLRPSCDTVTSYFNHRSNYSIYKWFYLSYFIIKIELHSSIFSYMFYQSPSYFICDNIWISFRK